MALENGKKRKPSPGPPAACENDKKKRSPSPVAVFGDNSSLKGGEPSDASTAKDSSEIFCTPPAVLMTAFTCCAGFIDDLAAKIPAGLLVSCCISCKWLHYLHEPETLRHNRNNDDFFRVGCQSLPLSQFTLRVGLLLDYWGYLPRAPAYTWMDHKNVFEGILLRLGMSEDKIAEADVDWTLPGLAGALREGDWGSDEVRLAWNGREHRHDPWRKRCSSWRRPFCGPPTPTRPLKASSSDCLVAR